MENPRIDGIDWRNLQKGDKIPKEKVLDFWNIHFKDKPWDERTSLLQVKGCIEKLREGINRPLVIRQRDYELFVLKDAEAVDYLAAQANSGIRKHRKQTRRMFTHVDQTNLNKAKKRDLETKQIHHAFIAAAADGARKESLQLQRKGERLPKSLIEKTEFKKSS